MPSFSEAKKGYETGLGIRKALPYSLVPVRGKTVSDIKIRGEDGRPLEEYFKWQFIYALINSGLYSKDYIGVEVEFPKGSKGSLPLKIDAVIFDDKQWLERYVDFKERGKMEGLQWLNTHILGVIEFKREGKSVEEVFLKQIKPAMREKDPSDAYVLGVYYDGSRLFLFHRRNGRYLRYDEAKNQKGERSQVGDLNLYLPDPYHYIPSFEELQKNVHRPSKIERTNRGINELEVITSITTVQVSNALSNVLRVLDKESLVNQRGYEILIQAFALKIFDEKRNEKAPGRTLEFYITEDEKHFDNLGEKNIQRFINRIRGIKEDASEKYEAILSRTAIEWNEPKHVNAIIAVCDNFQDFSFVRSSKSDLYQLVFYNFANKFQQQEKAQFLTPLDVIDFLVKIVNPRNQETLFDPCCGIGDFLSLSYVNAQEKKDPWKLDDANIYGADVSDEMITLASLNMLLNGDGDARLYFVPDKGSILFKIKEANPPEPVKLIPDEHYAGNWDEWKDRTKLKKFDVILTNPPFGEDRAYRPESQRAKEIVEMYETWGLIKSGSKIDLGVVFLENAYRCLKENGRMGIVLSNSIASIDRWKPVREWLLKKMRIVALFDLPPNVFAETGVNTTLIVAYKPNEKRLEELSRLRYSVFVRDIKEVGYEKRTLKRNVFFEPKYKFDELDFEIQTDENGEPIRDEDFSEAVFGFREWVVGQEEDLKKLFLDED